MSTSALGHTSAAVATAAVAAAEPTAPPSQLAIAQAGQVCGRCRGSRASWIKRFALLTATGGRREALARVCDLAQALAHIGGLFPMSRKPGAFRSQARRRPMSRGT
ncbi:hypothetical protein MTO96_017468 [Rhipicephalus appendiculatus]